MTGYAGRTLDGLRLRNIWCCFGFGKNLEGLRRQSLIFGFGKNLESFREKSCILFTVSLEGFGMLLASEQKRIPIVFDDY